MGREMKRKQAKKEGRNVKEVQIKKREANELKPKSLLIILGFIVGFFIILYFITAVFITKDFSFGKDNDNSDSSSEDTIYNRILAVDTLNQMDDEYYVFYYDSEEDDSLSNRIDMLEERVYRVDLSDGFNENYIGEVSGIVDDISDLRVESPSLVKVSNGKITEFYSGSEEISSLLS